MRRSLAYFLFASALPAQWFQTGPQQAPIGALTQGYQSALNESKYDEAAAKRDQARALLSQIPADDPQFANWTQQVSQMYEGGGFGAQARDVLEQGLARTAGLGEASPVRVALLSAVAQSWEQDRNLLKAVGYLEQAVAASEMTPPAPAAAPRGFAVARLSAAPPVFARVSVFAGNYGGFYQRLFSLYRQLGRPEDAAGVLARVAAKGKESDGLLAGFYQQQGQIDEAAAIYRREAVQAADPQQAAGALQQMAYLYQGAQRYTEAAAAYQEAIAKMEVSGGPSAAEGVRESLANLFQQAGQPQAADEVYQQLMSGPSGQQAGAVSRYASFLVQTKHVDQAEKLLSDYLANHSSVEPWEQNNLLMALANVERLSGKPELAEEYQRRAFPNQFPNVGAPNTMQRAYEAMSAGRVDEAFNLTLQMLDSAHRALELGDVYSMTSMLASQHPAKADELYQRAMAVAERWSPATVEPLLATQENYARFLQEQEQWGEFERAVESYSAALTAAGGAGTGRLQAAVRLRTIALYRPERGHDGLHAPQQPAKDALLAAQEMVKLEESLSGTTSEPYLNAIETLANAMEVNQDRTGALPLRAKTITVGDLVYNANDQRRGTTRMNAAMNYAYLGQFDEAEALAKEALAIGQHAQPPQTTIFRAQLQQIANMKQAAQKASAAKQ